jgi:glycogen(starch) synthase
MRVLMTADTIGGVWSHAVELADALQREGVDTVLAALGRWPSDGQRREAERVSGLVLLARAYRLPWMDDPWAEVALAGAWLLDVAREFAVDLVHLSEPAFASLPWPVPVVAVGHSCVLSWFKAVRGHAAPADWEPYRIAMTAGLGAADAVVAPSAAMLESLRCHYGVSGGSVVHNGRDPGSYQPVAKEHFVLTAGRLWDAAKNVALLGAVAPDLSWPVYAAGDTRSPTGGEADGGAVHLLGTLGSDGLAEAMGRAAIYALPARYEPFGQTVLEAGLSGCALVLGDIPSLRELWDGAAVFVPPDQPAPLRAVVTELISDPERRQSLATAARHRGLQYSPARMARGYLDIYDRVGGPVCAS